VLFAYLNASALPSKNLLDQAVSKPITISDLPNEREVGIPGDLISTVRYYKTHGRSATKPGPIESSILIDRRGLHYDSRSGLDRDKIARLFSWITDEKRASDFVAEVTCFVPDSIENDSLGATLFQREQRCRALNVFNSADLQPSFSARSVPKELMQLATSKGMGLDDMILITLKRTDGNG
jgi:hypothetical protein